MNTYTKFGLTYSAIVCLLILAWMMWRLFRRGSEFGKNTKDTRSIILLSMLLISGIIASLANGVMPQFDYIMKLIMPFMVFYYIKYACKEKEFERLPGLILIINITMVVQIIVCKAITGHFSASTYYTYIGTEEYFGYYNSPHPLSALLGLFSVWNIYSIHRKQTLVLNIVLFTANILLVVLLGVRTYMAAVALSIIVMIAYGTRNSKYRSFTIIALIFVAIAGLIIYFNMDKIFAGTRLDSSVNTSEITSGRNGRWKQDMNYYLHEYNFLQQIFGKGFGAINNVNIKLRIGNINSLNAIIDLLMDNGVVGLLLLVASYKDVVKYCVGRNMEYAQVGIIAVIATGLMINNILPYVTIMPMAIIMMLLINRNKSTIPERK
ncbi:MAG: O-antigen ligase family protein [Oscillospiraceae bacterium]|nr:O-antigen ligase family protein [Oscillospiraceae bacterium]